MRRLVLAAIMGGALGLSHGPAVLPFALRSPDFPEMKFNQFLWTRYFGPGLLPHEPTLWIDELAVGTKRVGPIEGR